MKIVYIRHSEPQYPAFEETGLIGFGRDLAPLTPRGIALATEAAKNPMLNGAELIVSSPLTRALQTAGIIASCTGLLIEVELGLIERRVDLSQKLCYAELEPLFDEYVNNHGIWPKNEKRNWESIEMQHKRLKAALDKYLYCKKIIVVSHGELGRRLRKGKLDFCGMFEMEYTSEFELLPYSEREEK